MMAFLCLVMQDNWLVSVVELEILLDDDFGIGRTFEVAKKVWAKVLFYLAQKQCDVRRYPPQAKHGPLRCRVQGLS